MEHTLLYSLILLFSTRFQAQFSSRLATNPSSLGSLCKACSKIVFQTVSTCPSAKRAEENEMWECVPNIAVVLLKIVIVDQLQCLADRSMWGHASKDIAQSTTALREGMKLSHFSQAAVSVRYCQNVWDSVFFFYDAHFKFYLLFQNIFFKWSRNEVFKQT